MQIERIGVLNNLRSGRSATRVRQILDLLSGHPDVAHVETSDAGAVPEALDALAQQDVDLLVVNGGDGTLQHALTELLERPWERLPLVAPLRGGRTNMSALDLGARRDPVRGLADLIAAARRGRIAERLVDRPVLRVASGRGLDHEVRCGMFFGAGVIHRGIEHVHQLFPHEQRGVFGASLVTGALLGRMALLGDHGGLLTPDKVHMLVDGSPTERGESLLVMATSLDRLFLRMRPFWGRGAGDVRFTSVAADAAHPARAVPGILAGRPGRLVTENNGYTSRNAARVDLRLDCGFTVDGELAAPRPDRIVSITADSRIRFVRA